MPDSSNRSQRTLRASDWISLHAYEPIEGEDPENVLRVRLAMKLRGESVVSDTRAKEILGWPYEDYAIYVYPVLETMQEHHEPEERAEGGYSLRTWDDAMTVNVRPIYGRDYWIMEQNVKPLRLAVTLTGLSEETLQALPLGDWQGVMTACDFLVRATWLRLTVKMLSQSQSSESPRLSTRMISLLRRCWPFGNR